MKYSDKKVNYITKKGREKDVKIRSSLLVRVVPDSDSTNNFAGYRISGWPDIRLNSKYRIFFFKK